MFIAQAALVIALATPLPTASLAPTPTASVAPTPTASPIRTIGTVATTAERKATPLSSTAQTTYVVTRAQIETNGDQTIADAIRNVPGMTFFQYGGFGAEASFGELGSLQSIVLLDGLPMTSGSGGAVDLGMLSSNDVDRIEVVESGGSTLYGSGGNGGVINIITSVPRSTYLSASYGSFGDRDVRVSTGNGTIGVSLERHVATNDYPYIAQNGLPAGIRDNAQAFQSDASIDYAQSIGPYSVRATARFSELDLGVPGPVAFAYGASELTPNEVDPSNRNDLLAKVARTDGKFTTSLTVSGFHQAVDDNGSNGLGPEESIIDARTNAALQETVVENDRTALVAGIDLSRESALDVLGQSGPPPSFSAAQSQSAIYAQQTIGIGPGGKVYAGLRAENDTPAGGTLEPSAGFLFPLGTTRIAVNAASSFIVPTLFDLYYPGYANPNLLPERDRNLNLVLANDRIPLAPTLTIFDRTASNLITDNANFVPVNAGRAHFAGATLSLTPKLARHFVTQFSITDLATATQVTNGITQRVDYEPVLQGTASIERPITSNNAIGYGLTAKLVGAHTESFAGPGTFGQYTNFDAYLRARLAPRAVLTARVDDLGDAHYEMFALYPVPARSYRLEISTR
jgi:vitamin B12 transporter